MPINKWADYISFLESKQPNRGMATFQSRFALAENFVGIEVEGLSQDSVMGYSRLAQVGLCYSVLEHLEQIVGIVDRPGISALDLANSFRTLQPNILSTIEKKMEINPLLRTRIQVLIQNPDCADIRPMVEVLRHSFFHGAFTPTGWKLGHTTESNIWLEGLAQVTLRKADETFTQWFKSQAKN